MAETVSHATFADAGVDDACFKGKVGRLLLHFYPMTDQVSGEKRVHFYLGVLEAECMIWDAAAQCYVRAGVLFVAQRPAHERRRALRHCCRGQFGRTKAARAMPHVVAGRFCPSTASTVQTIKSAQGKASAYVQNAPLAQPPHFEAAFLIREHLKYVAT
jgi:hypothetical protein